MYYVPGAFSLITSGHLALVEIHVHLVGPLICMRVARDIEVGAIPKATYCVQLL